MAALSLDVDSLAARLKDAITISSSISSSSSSSSSPFPSPSPPFSSPSPSSFVPLQSLADLVRERGSQSAFSCGKCRARLLRGVETTACVACGAAQPLGITKLALFSYKKLHAFQSFLHSLAPKDSEKDLKKAKDPVIISDKELSLADSDYHPTQASWDLAQPGYPRNQILGDTIREDVETLQAPISVELSSKLSGSVGDFRKAGVSDESFIGESKALEVHQAAVPVDDFFPSFMLKIESTSSAAHEPTFLEDSLFPLFAQNTIPDNSNDTQGVLNFNNLDDLFVNVKEAKSNAIASPQVPSETDRQPKIEHDLDFLFTASNSGTVPSSSIISNSTETLNESTIDPFDSFFSFGKAEEEESVQHHSLSTAPSQVAIPKEIKIDQFDSFFLFGKAEEEKNVQQGNDLFDTTHLGSKREATPFVDDFSGLESWVRKFSSTVSPSVDFFSLKEEKEGFPFFSNQQELDSYTSAAVGQISTEENLGAVDEPWDEDDIQWTSATTTNDNFQWVSSTAELVFPATTDVNISQVVRPDDFLTFQSSLHFTDTASALTELPGVSTSDLFQPTGVESSSLTLKANGDEGWLQAPAHEANDSASLSNGNRDAWEVSMGPRMSPEDGLKGPNVNGESNGTDVKVGQSGQQSDVNALLLEIHDLSFMLEDHLVIPKDK